MTVRQLPSRYTSTQPMRVKKDVARVKHLSAPLKGLSLSSKLVEGDPLKAPVLDNWVIEESQIKCRPGSQLMIDFSTVSNSPEATTAPVFGLIPYTGSPNKLAAAINGKIRLLDKHITTGANTIVKSGFTSNDWHGTFFSNLSDKDYTVLVNGTDGVWSWDGSSTSTDPIPVVVTAVSKSVVGGPAVLTVAAADIAKFANGMTIRIAGATGTGMVNINGEHIISSVNIPSNTFSLPGVDTSTASAALVAPTNVTADSPGTGMIKEVVTAPAAKPHIVPNQFSLVVSHMNRLFFADKTHHAIYYLPLQQKSGEVKELPLNAVFRRGGDIVAMYTWTVDGGAGLDDQLVIFSSNGEAVIYAGTDPDTDFVLTGIFRFDSPMSKRSIVNYGGELYVMISTGLVPMSTLMRAEAEQLGQADKDVFSDFADVTTLFRSRAGWQTSLDYTSGRLICNMPLGRTNGYKQMVRFMPNPVWATWSGLPSRCWQWLDNRLFFGSDDAKVYELNQSFLSDNGKAIDVDMQLAWSSYNTQGIKHFKMIVAYIQTDGDPQPYVDMQVNYNVSPPLNQPDVSYGSFGAQWDVARWDEDPADEGWYWVTPTITYTNWSGVGIFGRVGAPHIKASIIGCSFSISGMDVLYETGSVFG